MRIYINRMLLRFALCLRSKAASLREDAVEVGGAHELNRYLRKIDREIEEMQRKP